MKHRSTAWINKQTWYRKVNMIILHVLKLRYAAMSTETISGLTHVGLMLIVALFRRFKSVGLWETLISHDILLWACIIFNYMYV